MCFMSEIFQYFIIYDSKIHAHNQLVFIKKIVYYSMRVFVDTRGFFYYTYVQTTQIHPYTSCVSSVSVFVFVMEMRFLHQSSSGAQISTLRCETRTFPLNAIATVTVIDNSILLETDSSSSSSRWRRRRRRRQKKKKIQSRKCNATYIYLSAKTAPTGLCTAKHLFAVELTTIILLSTPSLQSFRYWKNVLCSAVRLHTFRDCRTILPSSFSAVSARKSYSFVRHSQSSDFHCLWRSMVVFAYRKIPGSATCRMEFR